MSTWIDCRLCGQSHEDLTACPPPYLVQPEEERMPTPHEHKIRRMVDRFLSWPLPATVASDKCACEIGYPNRIGTNLLNATEAEAMIRHVTYEPAAQAEAKNDGRWGLLELMGHQRIAGYIAEATIAGKGMLRVDVPDAQGNTSHTRFYSPEAVYCLTPTDRQIAIGLALNIADRPVTAYTLRNLATQKQMVGLDTNPEPEET